MAENDVSWSALLWFVMPKKLSENSASASLEDKIRGKRYTNICGEREGSLIPKRRCVILPCTALQCKIHNVRRILEENIMGKVCRHFYVASYTLFRLLWIMHVQHLSGNYCSLSSFRTTTIYVHLLVFYDMLIKWRDDLHVLIFLRGNPSRQVSE